MICASTESVLDEGQGPHRPSLKSKLMWGAITLCLAGASFFYFLRRPENVTPSPPDPVVRVDAVKADVQPMTAYVEALGTMFPRSQATLAAKLGGQITEMRLWKNQQVRPGEVIAVFQSSDLVAQRDEAAAGLSQARLNLRTIITATIPQNAAVQEKAVHDARANVANAQALVNRRLELFAQDGLARRDVEAAQLALTLATDELRLAERNAALRVSAVDPNQRAVGEQQVKQAEQRVAQLNIQLGYAKVRAPFDGVITDQFQFVGDYVAAGARLVSLADMAEMTVRAPFADTIAAQLHVGDSVIVTPADQPDYHLSGTVSLISNSVDPANRTVEVWVKLSNADGRLRSGASARVRVAARHVDEAVVIPAGAVTLDASTGATGSVMVVDSQAVAHQRKVTTGLKSGDLIQITTGLKAGEVVVTTGGYALPDGTKVQVPGGARPGAVTK